MGRRGLRVHLTEGAPLQADAVILATPARNSAELTRAMDPDLASLLAEIPSAPLAVVHFGYHAGALTELPSGFGFLVPRGQGPRILGTLWISSIFEDRAPDGRVLMTSMVGGAHDPEAVELEDAELTRIVREDLSHVMGIIAAPVFTRVVRHPHGIPQYTLGHPARLRKIRSRLESHPRLSVAGNSYAGISVNACIEEAPSVAEAVLKRVDTLPPIDPE
jgi:oxygen-dependent protoporphyrinogen oxidase